MKNTILALALLFVGCGGNVTAPPQAQKSAAVTRSGTVFVGDSIIGRWDLDSYFPGKGYVNAGWFGKRTDEMLAVFPSILDGSRVCRGFDNVPGDPAFPFSCQSIKPPAEVVILLGWNDMFQDFSTTQAAANIKSMAEMAKAAGVHVVLVVPYRFDSAHPASWMQPFDACATDGNYPFSLNQEPLLNSGIVAEGLPTANLETVFLAGCQSDYTIDGVHPNASGYQQMHDAIEKVI
jgi:hypothetical protein